MENLNILIVEDDPDISRMIRLTLAHEAPHFSIDTVDGGRECLDYLQNHDVDCILSDYQMPGMDGMELLLQLRKGGNDVPFIFLTAQGNEEVAREAFKNGAYDYFTKNIGFAHFPRIINSIEQAVRQNKTEGARLAAEKALRAEKDKLETILASIGEAISIQDMDYRVLYQNRAHSDIMGKHEGEYCYQAYERQDVVCSPCPLSDTLKDGLIHKTQKNVALNGRLFHIDITASAVKDPDGKVVAGIEIVRDITAQKTAETALEHRLRIEEAVAKVSSMIASGDEVDLNHVLGILGEAVSASRAYIFLFRDECRLMDNTHEWCSPGTRPEIQNLQGLRSTEIPWFMEHVLKNENFIVPDVSQLPDEASAERNLFEKEDIKSLAVVPMYSAGSLTGFVGFDDTTGPREWSEGDVRLLRAASETLAAYIERKKSEDRLRKLSKAVEQSANMISIAGPGCIIEYINPKFTELTGYTMEEVVGVNANSLREENSGQCLMLHDTINQGNDWKGEFRIRKKDGELFWVNASISPIKDTDGRITNFVCVQEDITERKKSEEALRDSEERYRMLFNSGGDEVHVLQIGGDGIPGKFMEVNETACRRLGYTREEFLELTPMDLNAPEEAHRLAEFGKNLFNNKGGLLQTVQIAKDGTRMPVEINAKLFDFKGRPTVYAVARDISDRIRNEAALRDSEERYRMLFNSGGDETYVLHLSDEGLPGTFLEVNETACRRLGYSRAELLKFTPADVTAPEYQDKLPEYAGILVREKRGIFTAAHISKDGRRWPVEINAKLFDYNGKPTVYAVARDITDRLRTEEEKARLAAAVASSADAICVTDTAGVIQYVNPAFDKISGYTKDESVGNRPETLLCSGMGEELFEKAVDAIGTGRAWSGNFEGTRKDGSRREYEATISPVLGPSGDVINHVIVARDVTDKKRLESIAESVNSMNNLGYVFASVRHEVGGPLNALKMTLGILNNNMDRYTKVTINESIARCLEEIGRVEYLMHSLKSFNMYESPKLSRMAIESFMDKFLSLVRNDFAKRGITVSYESEAGDAHVMIDPRALQQVMLNIMSNAADALTGVVGPNVAITVSAKDKMVVVRVQDNGPGMTDEQKFNLFKPFYTSKPNGTGLGLVIAKRMLSKMDGTIDIASSMGEGTTVTLTIPEDRLETA